MNCLIVIKHRSGTSGRLGNYSGKLGSRTGAEMLTNGPVFPILDEYIPILSIGMRPPYVWPRTEIR